MKKLLTLTLLLLVPFTKVSADNFPGYADPTCCYPACASYAFGFEASILLLQPTCSNMHYAVEALPLPVPTPNWEVNDIHTKYHVGFELGISAVHLERNTNGRLNYVHFYSSDSSTKVAGSNNMLGPFFEIGPDGLFYENARGSAEFHYDALNLDYGILIPFGDCSCTNLFWGIGAVRIKQELATTYSSEHEVISRKIKVPSRFLGIGPQIGLGFAYDICSGLQITGESTISLLVGKLKNHTSYASVSPALKPLNITPPNKQETHVHHRTQVVPALEEKLGVAYSFSLCNCTICFDAGYEVLFYINAIQSVDIGSEVLTPPLLPDTVGVYARTFQRTLSNFALAGPYLKMNIGF